MKALRLALLAGLVLAVATACGGSSSNGKQSLVLYSGQHSQLTDAMVSAFEKKTGIPVRIRTNDGVVLADQILQEGKHSPADVYLTENSPELELLDEKGMLAKLTSATLGQVPSSVSSPTGHWVGVARRISALAYDPSSVSRDQLPKSILDLAKPEWKGKVAVAPLDSDFPPLVGALIATKGKQAAADWLKGLKENADVYQDDESVVAAVNRGDVPVGIINQYYWYRLQLENGADKMKSALYYFPSGDVGSIENISGAAVLASSKKQKEAEQFVSFLASKEGQQLVSAGDDFEYPASPDVPPNKALPPLSTVPHTDLSVVKLGDDQEAAKLIQATGFGS